MEGFWGLVEEASWKQESQATLTVNVEKWTAVLKLWKAVSSTWKQHVYLRYLAAYHRNGHTTSV